MFNDLYDNGRSDNPKGVKARAEYPYLETYSSLQLRVLIYFLPIMWLVDIFS